MACLPFYGITKDPETNEFMMIMEFADNGTLRHILSSNFNNISWIDKIFYLWKTAYDLGNLHRLGYFHKDFHSGNILDRMILVIFQTLDYQDRQMNKNQKIKKYVECCHISLQKF